MRRRYFLRPWVRAGAYIKASMRFCRFCALCLALSGRAGEGRFFRAKSQKKRRFLRLKNLLRPPPENIIWWAGMRSRPNQHPQSALPRRG